MLWRKADQNKRADLYCMRVNPGLSEIGGGEWGQFARAKSTLEISEDAQIHLRSFKQPE